MRPLILILSLLLALPAQAADWLYLTYPGDTLIGIGRQYLKNPDDWPKVQVANSLRDPRKMPSNTRIRIPVELLKVTPAAVTVTAVSGNVRVKRGDGPFQALKANERLTGGETVLTGPRSTAAFRFADGTTLTQQASGRLVFGRLAAYGKTGMVSTEVSLEGGRLEASAARQQAPAGGFRVITPVAVAGLRGTGFRLNLAEDGKTLRSEVLDGAVAIESQGVEVTVAGGQGTIAELGKPPAPPRTLLARPDLGGLPARVTHLPLSFSWPDQADATAWRAQIAADAAFASILMEDVLPRPEAVWMSADDSANVKGGEAGGEAASPEALADGTYHLRVRAIDADGLEGLHADHAFTLDARPLPPPALGPCLGERLLTHEADFSWSAAAGAQGYLLQIAPTPAFDKGMIERRLPGVTRHRETLAVGDWHWRIASLDAAGEPRAFGPHRAFRVQPPAAQPAAPGKPSAVEEGGLLRITWQGEAPAYLLEIARDAGFQDMYSRHAVIAPHALLIKPAPGNYWLRVIALDATGAASAPGDALPVAIQPLAAWWLLPFMFIVP